jgi:phosphoribosylglycinamide formyltransferase-1
MPNTQVNIAIFASGAATNAKNITRYFLSNPNIKVALLASNKIDSGIPAIAREYNIPYYIFNRDELYHSDKVIQVLHAHNIHLIVLAGFLWLVPENLIQSYKNRILNIHPALLPKYGGKGMYGMRVHKAVKESQDKETGITIHLVNEEYDKGTILHQSKTEVLAEDTLEDIARKVHDLEYKYYPVVIEEYIYKHIFIK